MTTAERFRRRQRIEAAFLVALGLFVCIITYIDDRQDDEREDKFQACLIDQFSASSDAQIARGDVAAKQSEAISKVINGVSEKLVLNDLEGIEQVLAQYKVDQDAIDADREANPFTPFPSGECES